jgi:hypothetical protein
MKTNDLILLLQCAGVLHVGLLGAGAMMPGVVGVRRHLVSLPPFLRQLFWVYYAFIGLCLAGFGLITFALAPVLAEGGSLARAVCFFFGLFWTLRLCAATFIFDLRPYLTNGWRRLGLHAVNVVFAVLPIIYFWSALR